MSTAVVIGDAASAAMQPVAGSLAVHSAAIAARYAVDVESAVRLADEENWQPDLCLVCQHTSDEFSAADVRQLLINFPLTRIICCYGPWCASDGRTRDIWPAAVRVPASLAPLRIARELRVLRGEIDPLPLTAALDEIYEFDHADNGRS